MRLMTGPESSASMVQRLLYRSHPVIFFVKTAIGATKMPVVALMGVMQANHLRCLFAGRPINY